MKLIISVKSQGVFETYDIFIDGEFALKVKEDKEAVLDTSNMSHTLELKSPKGKSSLIKITPDEKEELYLNFITNFSREYNEDYFELVSNDSRVETIEVEEENIIEGKHGVIKSKLYLGVLIVDFCFISALTILIIIVFVNRKVYCDKGDTLVDKTCISKKYVDADAVCPMGYRYYDKGLGCTNTFRGGYYVKPSYYKCKEGILINDKCLIETTYDAHIDVKK